MNAFPMAFIELRATPSSIYIPEPTANWLGDPMTHDANALDEETVTKCKLYSGWFAFQDLHPDFAMFLMSDPVHNPEFMRAIDGKVYVSTFLLSAFVAGDNDWLHEARFPRGPSGTLL